MNFVPFSEKCVEMVVDLYRATARHSAVINGHILEHIIKVPVSKNWKLKMAPNINEYKLHIVWKFIV